MKAARKSRVLWINGVATVLSGLAVALPGLQEIMTAKDFAVITFMLAVVNFVLRWYTTEVLGNEENQDGNG